MKIAWVILACGLMRVFVSAQEVTTPTPASTPPPRVYPVALPNYDEETATRLQIFLDNSDFGPGKIDGKMGEFFRKALISYKHAHAMPKTGNIYSRAKFSRCRMSYPLKSKNSQRERFLRIPRSPRVKPLSTQKNICWRSSTTTSSSAFFRSRQDRQRCQRRSVHGKFSASTSGRGFATTKACSTTACARRITITFRPARIISSGFFGWV